MTSIELFEMIASILTSLGVFAALVALAWQFGSLRREKRIALREATLPFFRAWWGVDPWIESDEGEQITVPELRAGFFEVVGSPNDKPEDTILAELGRLREQSPFGLGQVGEHLKELVDQKKVSLKSKGIDQLRELSFFYDMIGWFGAHGLIDVDYILGPMQHHMRRTWWVTRPLVERDRQPRSDYWLDPVRFYGFQWLFEYSEKKKHNQADLIRNRLAGLSLLTHDRIAELKNDIEADEKSFRAHLRAAGWPVADQDGD